MIYEFGHLQTVMFISSSFYVYLALSEVLIDFCPIFVPIACCELNCLLAESQIKTKLTETAVIAFHEMGNACRSQFISYDYLVLRVALFDFLQSVTLLRTMEHVKL